MLDENLDENLEDSSASDENEPTEEGENTEDSEDQESKDSEENTPERTPFHKHPRFREIIQAKKEAEAKAKAADEERQALLERLDKIERNVTPKEDIPEWFTEGFGESPDLWKKFNEYNTQTREQLKQEVIDEIQGKEQARTKQDEESRKYVRDEIQRLKDDGNDFDENKLKKFMLDYKVLDFDKGLELYQSLNKNDSVSTKKKIASKTQSAGKSEGESKVKTLDGLFGQGW